MISSPDLVAFTKEPDFRETPVDPLALPEELSVPMYPYTGDTTPWSKLSIAKFKKDFIILSEFSEQVGPQPLLTVPPETKACGTFDLNHFSLRIMSVDYQTSLTCSGIFSPKLSFVEDSKVVLGDSKEGSFAYVHHFTLYDLEARGFVRPFCLAYVSSDENKIIQQFQQLSTEFSKVSECLKTGNRKNFANELETKLRDLEYTKAVLLRELGRVNNTSVKYTSEREWTSNGIPTLETAIVDGKQEEKSLPKGEVKVQEKGGCGHSREKAEVKNCILKLESEIVSNNRSVTVINSNAEEMSTYKQEEQFEEQWKDKQKKDYCSMPMAEISEGLTNVEKSIQEHKSLLKQVTSYPTRKLRNSEFSPYEPDDLPYSLEFNFDESRMHRQLAGSVPECGDVFYTNTPLHSPKLINTTSCKRYDRCLKTLEELCDEYFHQQALQQLRSIEKTFRGDASHIYTSQLCQNLLCNLKSTNFMFEDISSLEEAAGLHLQTAVNHSSIHQACFLPAPTILSEPISLESYASCVEMVPIKLELGESSHSATLTGTLNAPCDFNSPLSSEIFPEDEHENKGLVTAPDFLDADYVSAVMKTSISSGDSIEVLGTEKSFRSQSNSDIPTNTALPKPLPLFSTAAVEGVRPGRVPTRRTYSEDSIEVLSTTDSIRPEDLRASYPYAIDEESPEQETDEKDMSENQKDEAECFYSLGYADLVENGGVLMEEPLGCPTVTLTPPEPAMISHSQDECHASSMPFPLLEEPCRTVRDDLSDCFSFQSTTASDCTFFACIHGDKREGGTRHRCGRMGRAALKFLRQFPFAVHAVFSLLTGRTLVVLGSEEAAVRKLVTALSIYTPYPGRCRESIQPWTSMPLQLTDLLSWKLVGFKRMCSLTTSLPHCIGHYSRYFSVLDVDQKTLRSPTYNGTLIHQLVDPKSHIIRGITYYSFAQSVLGKLVARAFLLSFSRSRRARFHEELHRDDEKVLQYLSELIKLHFTEGPANVIRFSYTANTVFKL